MMRIGDLEFDLINDGVVHVDAGGMFGLVPRALYQHYLSPDSQNTIPMFLNSLLIRSRDRLILVDTGIGDRLGPKDVQRWGLQRECGGLIEGLAMRGVSPHEIDIVVNTHLHSDHCGGNTRWEGETLVATFPNAEYWVQRMEWAEACHPDARTRGTYFSDNFSPLMHEGRLRLLHGDTEVTDQVRCVVTPGHTRGHQSVILEEDGWKGIFLADMASYAIHFARVGWLAAYDVLPLENVATKTTWQRWALEHQAWLFVEHDPIMPVARLVEREGKIKVETVEEAQPIIEGLPRLLQPGE